MARKKTVTKKTTKKSPAKKPVTKKSSSKKAATKKTTKKAAAKKTTKKAATKKTTKKATTKKTAKKAATKKTTKKAATKKTTTKKTTTKKATTKKTGGRKKLGARSVAEAASAVTADAQGYVFINGRRVRMISTGGAGIPKKTRTAEVAPETTVVEEKATKTTLTAKELRHYRELLLTKRGELVGDLTAMESAALDSGGDNISKLPVHMADVGSDTYAQDLNIGLAEKERMQLREIDEALVRIRDKTYGMCVLTGERIPDARLEAKPWAKYTIEAKRQVERRGG